MSVKCGGSESVLCRGDDNLVSRILGVTSRRFEEKTHVFTLTDTFTKIIEISRL